MTEERTERGENGVAREWTLQRSSAVDADESGIQVV